MILRQTALCLAEGHFRRVWSLKQLRQILLRVGQGCLGQSYLLLLEGHLG